MKQIFLLVIICLVFGCKSDVKTGVELFEVKKDDFVIDVVESGEIQATSAVNISSPAIHWRFGMLKIIDIVDDGLQIHKGDTVVVFDPSDVHKSIVDMKADLEIALAEYARIKTEQQMKIEELEANLKTSEINLEISQIKLEQASFEAEVTKKEIQLNLNKARINLTKVKAEINNQKRIQWEELQRAQIKVDQLKNELEEANKTLEKLTVISPASGVVVIEENRRSDMKWQEGDQPWPGQTLIKLPDLSELKANSVISEVDISKIAMKQSAEIRLDAYSEEKYTGEIISIAALATFKNRGSKIKVFPVEILINESSDKLLPGMTVSCRILVDKVKDVIFIPHEALFEDEEGNYVYIQSGVGFKKQKIETGSSNNDFILIKKGLKVGDQVALNDPFEKEEDKPEKEEI